MWFRSRVAAVARRAAPVAVHGTTRRRRLARLPAAPVAAAGRAVPATAVGAGRAGLTVAFTRWQRPEPSHGHVRLVLAREMERGVARVDAELGVLIDGCDPDLFHLRAGGRRAGEGLARED